MQSPGLSHVNCNRRKKKPCAHERQRLEATSRIVLLNRENGPDKIMEMMEDRAPDGFKNIDDVISHKELEAIANH